MMNLDAWLDNQPLPLPDEIHLLDVREEPLYSPAPSCGPDALPRRTGLQVELTLALRSPDPTRRLSLLERLLQWCRGRMLTLSCRPGQGLMVRCTLPPALHSTLRWTEEISLRLAALRPYWTGLHPIRHPFPQPAADHTATLTIPGTAPCAPLQLEITPAAPLQSLRVHCGSTRMTLQNLSLSPGHTITMGEDDAGRFFLRRGDASLLHCRTMDSSDSLTLPPCQPTPLSITGDAPFSGQALCFPRYM